MKIQRYRCKICNSKYSYASNAIRCCAQKTICKKYSWTESFQIGDIICVEGLYFKSLEPNKNNIFIADIINNENFNAYKYYYVIIGTTNEKLIIYNLLSEDIDICGGFISKEYSHFIDNSSLYLKMKYSEETLNNIIKTALNVPSDTYVKLINNDLINNEKTLYELIPKC